MKTIMQKYQIIQLKKKGWSNNRIHKEFGFSRNTIRKYWNEYQEGCNKLIQNGTGIVDHDVIESLIENPKYDSSNRKPRKYTQEIDDLLRKILCRT